MPTLIIEHLHRLGAAAGLTLMLLVYQNLVAANSSLTPHPRQQLKNQISVTLP